MGRTFAEQLPDGRRGDLAVSALEEITFVTDGKGSQLPAPVSMLIAGNRDLTKRSEPGSQPGRRDRRLDRRDPRAGPPNPELPAQVRSLGRHRDRETGIDRIFAGQDPRGVFRGIYDPISPGTHVRSQRCAPRNSVSL